ncbi:hypothetical protein AKJ46_00255 [candidate division MSBL1 archaeon SCGC-AAA833K04]|uniref:CARDB domain-containing protein n=1 Tax=candidate division MSBL1 archaeon SCGC-AAA833K04 TaxID=1698258 RepID=A0A133VSW3_9EURY|nr:hypothetical protein AKJ46_00255 [candidate division MSBL1 archaeon SCGC-AAA833K04]
MNKKFLIIVAVFSLTLSTMALPSANAQEDLSISVNVPDKVDVGENMSGSASISIPELAVIPEDLRVGLYVGVYVDNDQILAENIEVGDGETISVSFWHVFEKPGSYSVKVEGEVKFTGPFGERSFSGSKKFILEAEAVLKKLSISGASFAIPETLKDDIPSYKAEVPDKLKDLLPVEIPTTGFLLANEDNILLVLSTKSDKGIASVEGWVLPKSLDVKGISLNVMVADTVSFNKEGTPASVGEILSNPDKHRLDLVKVNATRRHASILYDPDDNTGIEFPVTAGYLVEKTETVKSFLRKVIEKGKEIIEENAKPQIIKDVLQTENTRLPVFDFETDYWINSPAVTNGIVLPSGSQVIDILGKFTPVLDRLLQLDNGIPVLYDVKTNLIYEDVFSIRQIKENPEQFRGKMVGFTAKGFGGGISVQEGLRKALPCVHGRTNYIDIQTPEGPVCVPVPLDVRLEGLIAWNEISLPPTRADFLLCGGASSIHQDRVYKTIRGRHLFIGKVLSTKQIDNSLPEGLALVVYDRERIGDIDYEEMAESAKEEIENRTRQMNFSLTGFSKRVLPGIPVQPPVTSVSTPEELPEIMTVERAMDFSIKTIKPETPVEIHITKSVVDEVSISVKNKVSGVWISIEKLPSLPPEVEVEPPGELYRPINISVQNLPEDAIENAGITFWVLKEWLSTHDFDKGDILLQRYHAGGWENLPTEFIAENATHFKYSAQTPGFSTFAITAVARVGVPSFSVSNLSISKKTVKPGESTTITVNVVNTGGSEGTYSVELLINNEAVDSKQVTLSPGESKSVNFTVSRPEAGTYEVSIDGQSGSFEVKKPAKPKPEEGLPIALIIGGIAAIMAIAGVVFYRKGR